MATLRQHAIDEMARANVDDDIYGDMTSKAVLELIDTFNSQGHSGASANLVLSIFNRVVDYQNLTPLTDDPDEWLHHDDTTWQNKRNTKAFSSDQGKTYKLIGEGYWRDNGHGPRTKTITYYETQHVERQEEK